MPSNRVPSQIEGKVGYYALSGETAITATTFEAALASASLAVSGADRLLAGERVAVALCRPPGHHASRDQFGGYCFLNNAAIAAERLARGDGAAPQRVAILDVDFHHGNGTQQIFYERDDVQFVSLHGDPARAYPYFTGYADEVGTGRGRGATLNVPLPARTADDPYLDALDRACEAVRAFGPSLVVVSLGLDTFVTDPIADLAITTDGFRRSGERVGAMGLPTVVLQEGGYDVAALGDNVRAWLTGLAATLR